MGKLWISASIGGAARDAREGKRDRADLGVGQRCGERCTIKKKKRSLLRDPIVIKQWIIKKKKKNLHRILKGIYHYLEYLECGFNDTSLRCSLTFNPTLKTSIPDFQKRRVAEKHCPL